MARRKFQNGSLFKRGKRRKVWVGRWWEDYLKPDGTLGRRRRAETIGLVAELPTRRKAMQVFSERLRGINSGDHRPQSTRRFVDFANEDWAPVVIPTVKLSTQKHYRHMLDVHLVPALGDSMLCNIGRADVQRLVTAKLQSGLAWKTVSHIRVVLGRILATAEEWGYIQSNPVRKTKLPRRPAKPERVIVSPDDLRGLSESLSEPARSLTLLLVLTGLRVGELTALRWGNVDLDDRLLLITESVYEGQFDTPKTGHSVRRVPIGENAASILAALRPENPKAGDLVFSASTGKPLNRRNLLRRHLQPACERLGLPKLTWHQLRHQHASLLDSVGASLGTVQAALGHSSPEITRKVYIHALADDQRRSVEAIEGLFFGPEWTQVSMKRENGNRLIN